MQRDPEATELPLPRKTAGFPSELRLKQGARIREVLDRGRRAAGERVLLVVLANELDHARLGCIVGRRYDKRAVVRNRWRRRIREIFRTHRAAIEADAPGWDWVAIALKREGEAAFARLEKDFLGTAARARRARDPGSAPRRSAP